MSTRPPTTDPLSALFCAPATRAPSGAAPGLLVAVCTERQDLVPLEQAAARARLQRRPLRVALVEPARPITVDAAIHARYDRRRDGVRRDVLARVMPVCAGVPELGCVTVARPWAATAARADRALRRRLRRVADRDGLELHPHLP